MGGSFSAPPSPNTSQSQTPITTMSSQNQSDNIIPKPKTVEPKSMDNPKTREEEKEEKEGEEEEGECGFCLYMKGGECRDTFVAWEKCIEEAEENQEDIAEKCFKVHGALKACMQTHHDYYEPILTAEKAADEVAERELERETAEERENA